MSGGTIDGRVLVTTYSVRHDREAGGGAIHARVFVRGQGYS